jgi:hypothetical protein
MENNLTENQYMNLDQLLPGDILTFKGNRDDVLSRLIMDLTNGSDVSHGAIFVQKKDFVLAESGELGIHAHKMIAQVTGGSEAYVLRHKDAGTKGIVPATDVAKQYVLRDLPYPFSDLIFLGLILLFKNNAKKNLISRAVVDLMCLVAAELKTRIEEKKGPGFHTLVCSSYVYQCYLEASENQPNLKLNVKNGDIGFGEHRLLFRSAKSSNSLLDLFEDYVKQDDGEFKNRFYARRRLKQTKKLRPVDAVLKDLEMELSVKCNENLPMLRSIDWEIVKDFIDAVGDVIEAVSSLISDHDNLTLEEMIENARKQQAMFITPNDLRNHLTNADYIGMIRVSRDSNDYDQNFKTEM